MTPPLEYFNEQLPEDIATSGNGHLAARGSFKQLLFRNFSFSHVNVVDFTQKLYMYRCARKMLFSFFSKFPKFSSVFVQVSW